MSSGPLKEKQTREHSWNYGISIHLHHLFIHHKNLKHIWSWSYKNFKFLCPLHVIILMMPSLRGRFANFFSNECLYQLESNHDLWQLTLVGVWNQTYPEKYTNRFHTPIKTPNTTPNYPNQIFRTIIIFYTQVNPYSAQIKPPGKLQVLIFIIVVIYECVYHSTAFDEIQESCILWKVFAAVCSSISQTKSVRNDFSDKII